MNENKPVNQTPTTISTQALRATVQPFTVIDKEQDEVRLPFVGVVGDGDKQRHSYWAVHPTGRYADDLIIGRAYGLKALQFALGKEWPGLLRAIINELPKKKRFSGIEHGFLEIITDCALFGAMNYGSKMIV